MAELLTNDEVREALSLDFDYSETEISDLAKAASSYIKLKTDYDFTLLVTPEPLAKRAAKMFVQMTFYGGQNYKKEYDFSFGLSAAIVELQIIARNLLDAA